MARSPQKGLRLVSTEAPQPILSRDFAATDDVRTLFLQNDPSVLIFAEFDALREADFVTLIVSASPKVVLDIRAAPRFDVGTLNRRLVFSIFEGVGAKYLDVTGLFGSGRAKDICLDPGKLAQALKDSSFRKHVQVDGPIMFLSDPPQAEREFMNNVAHHLDELNERGWKLIRIPEFSRASAIGHRSVIFISHATPNDNDFARWLSVQLTLAGYDTWADFDQLRGGELFWDTIEETIRNRAARVVVAGSRLAQSRNGVLDEINLAISVERTLGISEFVIPLKIDDLPYSEFRANIARKDILDFSENWASGLARLLEALDRARVPKNVNHSATSATVFHSRLDFSEHIAEIPDPLLLSWVEVKSLPSRIFAYRLNTSAGKLQTISKNLTLPHVQYHDTILSFASPSRFSSALPLGITASGHGVILTSEFEKGRATQFPNLHARDVRKLLANLARQGWERLARSRGLQDFSLASRSSAWFLQNDLILSNKVVFKDQQGVQRRKSLVGFSAKRSVFWHYAIEMRVAIGDPLRFNARPHVIFSTDGKRPVESAARMHALRRGFCKSWWNDRWRDLTVAYLAWLGSDQSVIEIDMGGDEPLLLSARMMDAVCPVSPVDDPPTADDAVPEIDWEADSEDTDLDDEEIVLISASDAQFVEDK